MSRHHARIFIYLSSFAFGGIELYERFDIVIRIWDKIPHGAQLLICIVGTLLIAPTLPYLLHAAANRVEAWQGRFKDICATSHDEREH